MAKATTVGAVGVDLKLNDSNYDKQLNNKLKSSENAFSGTFKKIGGFIAGAFAVKQVVDFTKECVSSASKVQSAFTGLNSIVQGTGNSFSEAQEFIKKYTADGLVSIEETATAYKNLLSRGYDTSQIEDTLTRLKDSAAFGRQASYDLGEAVVTATEGLKNENSILVDNAGVTKNVAKMWEDWAKAHGTTTSAMTQAQKIQAEYNGIMEETKFQVGDASAYTKTFSGQIQQLKFNFNQMTVAIGKVVTPIAQLFIPIINSAINAVTRLFEKIQVVMGTFGLKMPDVVSKTSNSIAGIGTSAKDSANDAVASAKKINKAFAGVDEINVLKTKDTTSKNDSVTSGGNTSIGITETQDNEVSSAIKNTICKIEKYLKPSKNISFEPLINAFNNLKNAIEPFGEKIGNGLSWLYFNVLTPLATFTTEDIIPSFLNILSGALNVLNQAIEDVQPLFDWLWNSILQPMLSWTGDLIVSGLNGIADALNWISQNEIAMSILEGIAIAIGAVAGAIAIYNGAMAICNVVTGIFSGIMTVLTSPITLVVLAIGALIAVIILCVKHWDDIKEAAGKCWDGIKSIWGSASSWFDNKIIQPIKNLFGNLSKAMTEAFKTPINLIIDGINLFTSGLNKIKIPDWVPGVGGKGLNIGKIPKLAQGGYFKKNDPQLAIVGDNKREPEITTPESKIYEQAMKAIKDSNSSTDTKEMRIILEVRYEDGRKIIKKINQAQIEEGEVLLLV